MTRLSRLRAPFKRLRRDQSGAVTVEAVLWTPIIFAILYLIADVSLVFHRQSEILRQVQAQNRAFATGRISRSEISSNIKTAIKGFAPTATVTTTYDSAVRMVSTTVTVNASEMMAGGAFRLLRGKTISVYASQLTEI